MELDDIIIGPPTPSQSAYFLALGRFMHAFAQVERTLFHVLWKQSGTSYEVAKAVFSGARADTARDYINRILDATDQARPPELTRAFAQFGIITKARNDIVHYGADFEAPEQFTVSNFIAAHVPSKRQTTVISAEILDDMRADLTPIGGVLASHLWRLVCAEEGLKTSRMDQMLATYAEQIPWRYKPQRLSPQPIEPPVPPPERKPWRGTSPKKRKSPP